MFEAANSDDYGRMKGETLRFRIKMDIREPIKRGTNIKPGAMAEKVWIPITYEKLPCYYCGMLGHTVQECVIKGEGSTTKLMYGVELRESHSSKGITKDRKCDSRGFNPRGRGRGRFGRGWKPSEREDQWKRIERKSPETSIERHNFKAESSENAIHDNQNEV